MFADKTSGSVDWSLIDPRESVDEIEGREELGGGLLATFAEAAPLGEQAVDAFGRHVQLAIVADATVAVALGEPAAILADDQRQVVILRRRTDVESLLQ
jgi:hypothetical protein